MSAVEETKVDGNVPSQGEKAEEANQATGEAVAQDEVKKQKKPKPNNKKLRQGKTKTKKI